MTRPLSALLVAVCLASGASSLVADETYTLKLYESKTGDKTAHETNETHKFTVSFTVGGMDKKEESVEGKKEAYTEEILEKKAGARRATKLKRTYTVAETTKKGETASAVYAGKTVLIERTGDKYEFRVNGKVLSKEEAANLEKEFNEKKDDEPQPKDFLPEGAIKVGGSWTVPAEKSERIFKTFRDEDMKIDVKKSTIAGKLLKVYKKDGAHFGVIEATLTLVTTEMNLGGQFIKTEAGSKLVFIGMMDVCIDGSNPTEDNKATMTGDITLDHPAVGLIKIKGATAGVKKVRPAQQ